LQEPISITALSSVSALGVSPEKIWDHYLQDSHLLSEQKIGDATYWVAALPKYVQKEIAFIRNSDSKYKDLDDTVLYAIYVARKAVEQAGWKGNDNFGINLGSSRGATALFEKYHTEFLQKQRSSTLSSPTTTLGNISSWLAHDLKSKGPDISHSITCSTALHAMLNGVAWIQAGMAKQFMVGGSEAPLTPFTIAQMKALKIYSNGKDPYPCRALDLDKQKNSMVLGEGAAVACLEKGVHPNAIALISGIGYATEPLTHNISISSDADCFQRSMQMALGKLDPSKVDAIVMHAPGTIRGDRSEKNAIEKIFCNKTPFLTTNKWKIGHTFAASGMLSIALAILMLEHQKPVSVPYIENVTTPKQLNNILVNAVGFGGNAVSVLLSKK